MDSLKGCAGGIVGIVIIIALVMMFIETYPVLFASIIIIGAAIPISIYFWRKHKEKETREQEQRQDKKDYLIVLQTIDMLQNTGILVPIKPSVMLALNDRVYFERKDAKLITYYNYLEQGNVQRTRVEKSGSLLLTDSRMLFTSDELTSLPYENLGTVGFSPCENRLSQVNMKMASLVNGDTYEFCIPLANEDLLKLYFGHILAGFKQSQIREQFVLPADNICPRCKATLVDGKCEYCRWTPAVKY